MNDHCHEGGACAPTFSIELISGLPHEDLAEKLEIANRLSEAGHRAVAFYLHEMEERRIHQLLGFASAVEFARLRLEMSRRKARDLLAVGRALQELVILDEAFREGRLSWSKTRLLARICAQETQEAWIERASQRTVRELEREVASSQVGQVPRDEDRGLAEPRLRIAATVDTLTYELWELAKSKLRDEIGEEIDEGDALRVLCETLLSSSADGTIPGRKRLDGSLYRVVIDGEGEGAAIRTEDGSIELDTATAEMIRCDASCTHDKPTSPGMRKRVLARDGFRCRSCGSRRCLMVHHIRWRSHGGPTVLANLVSVCGRCHSWIHAGLLRVVGEDAKEIRFLDSKGRERRRRPGSLSVTIARPDGAHAPAASSTRLLPQDIPDVISPEWWQAHQHLLEIDGGRLRLVTPKA